MFTGIYSIYPLASVGPRLPHKYNYYNTLGAKISFILLCKNAFSGKQKPLFSKFEQHYICDAEMAIHIPIFPREKSFTDSYKCTICQKVGKGKLYNMSYLGISTIEEIAGMVYNDMIHHYI